MTTASVKITGYKKGTENQTSGYVVYNGTKAYCVPQSATLALSNGVLTCTGNGDAIYEIDPSPITFVDFSSNLETKTVKSGATQKTVNPSSGKVGFSSVIVQKVEGGESEGGYSVGDFAYIDLPYSYKGIPKKAPEYEITDLSGRVFHCYKVKMIDAGDYMGAQIVYLDGTNDITIPLNEIVGKFFNQKIE